MRHKPAFSSSVEREMEREEEERADPGPMEEDRVRIRSLLEKEEERKAAPFFFSRLLPWLLLQERRTAFF